jgi:hypothetical protein
VVNATETGAAERARLIEVARTKPAPPYTLDEELTFFCPQENVDALDLPVVREFQRWAAEEHRSSEGHEPAVLLLLPCQKEKPYTLSAEHRAVNRALVAAGYRPRSRGDWPGELAVHAEPELLSNAALVGHGVRIDRAVLSEPFGVVPYEAIYTWRGEPSPCARYDDPGLFEHRGLACPWRPDSTALHVGDRYRWRDGERAAFVEAHNRLVSVIGDTLAHWRDRYTAVLAYVAAGLTHRSFLASAGEKRASGLRVGRRAWGRTLPLDGVGDRHPGLVRLVPDAEELSRLRTDRGSLPADVLARPWCLELLTRRLAEVRR